MIDHHPLELRQVSVQTSDVDLAKELTEARDALGWTQEELADRLGISEETVSNWERGITKKPRSLKRIRQVLGIDSPPSEQPPTHSLDDEELWRQLRDTVGEIERRFYLRNPPERSHSGTEETVPAHLRGQPAKRLKSEPS